ncbi:MAG: aminotransferase class III-fold pyridoxal phosphate-dependent enzyme [Flammeovirgaceae bacterium]|mgnify:FL=1|jgi:acetylornithine/N-succinyldiaminopimelate aminotransferase|nr:aminotransferase class III-fold pyridoxal phosphate-dependent enzyme [Flammeovirgaceae bacterium]|tara:strand:+ start:5140 stop:6285 length:1146 start_codon:yes stop_codon:yes gene_type:complete
MKLFDVYPRYDLEPVSGLGSWIWDQSGGRYLDFYGGHAVISIGHSHPHYVDRITTQLRQLGFYSNSVQMPIQAELAMKLGKLSAYPDYQLFLCNSGAEAIENALKLASFHTKREKIIVFERAFHGRTSLAVTATDGKKIVAPININDRFIRLPFNDLEAVSQQLDASVAAVLIEGIQGVGGIHVPTDDFLRGLKTLCKQNGSLFILDEIQSGYGRSGKFFSHQFANVTPDLITIAKGMGNGFPIAGVLIQPDVKPWSGMLGTTFGGNHLACAAGLAVLEVIETEKLIENAKVMGEKLWGQLALLEGLEVVRGRGLMVGLDLPVDSKSFRNKLLIDQKVFVGSASNPNTIRLLPSLALNDDELLFFLSAFKSILQDESFFIG